MKWFSMKILRILLRTLVLIPLAAIVYFVILVIRLLHPISSHTDFKQTKPYKWNKVQLGRNTVSGDGSGYHMYSKRGGSNNLIIYFSGGGMAWDARSAFSPTGITSLVKKNSFGYYFNNIPMYILVSLHGIFDNKKAENPFRGWNIVYIPYSTGDMHIGNSITAYTHKGRIKEIHHNGKYNTLACLDWIYESFENPDKIMVCGDSAGAFAAPYWVNTIAGHYRDSRIFCLSDGAHLRSRNWPAIIDGIWKCEFEDTFGYKPTDDPLAEAFINTADNNILIMHTNTLYDRTLASYQADINNEPKGRTEYIHRWSKDMLNTVSRLTKSTPNYHFYLTKYGYYRFRYSTPHTLTRYPRFYKANEGGISFTKWLDDIINRGNSYDVGADYLAKPEI